jgi:hypothetical protein
MLQLGGFEFLPRGSSSRIFAFGVAPFPQSSGELLLPVKFVSPL